ncbi:unnamed protein product [Polarella glacialis]|uniref:H(+)-exporting diphosphatase n=1 Tax=Polarella glacialis TaxID=89957 RepID=A0A813DN12_POLGL|nr:unnamed protein product [Polarella glacialis]
MGQLAPEICVFCGEFFTSMEYPPVRSICQNSHNGIVHVVLQGFAQGFLSACLPAVVMVIAVMLTWSMEGHYGIALLSSSSVSGTGFQGGIASFGAIATNAHKIVHLTTYHSMTRHRANICAALGDSTSHAGSTVGAVNAFSACFNIAVTLLAQTYTRLGLNYQGRTAQSCVLLFAMMQMVVSVPEPDFDPGPIKLLPWSAKLCLAHSFIIVVSMMAVWFSGETPLRWTEPDPEANWHARTAVLLIFSAALAELCFLASNSVTVEIVDENMQSQMRLHGTGDSILTLGEYAAKFWCGTYLWYYEGGIIHTDQLAWGGPRPVYLGRFAQWSIAVPILVLISNRSAPALLLSALYVWSCWLMEVTTNPAGRWFLLVMTLLGFVFVSLDQACLALQFHYVSTYRAKVFMIVYQFVTFTMYAAAFLMGRFGLVGCLAEQQFYAYADATIKVFQGAILAMIRNFEDLRHLRHWWLEAVSAKDDFERLVKAACVPVFSLDKDGLITKWNENMIRITGVTCEDALGKQLEHFLGADSREAFQTLLHDSLNPAEKNTITLGSNMLELNMTCVAGSRALMMNIIPQVTQEGKIHGLVGIGQDITEICELKAVEAKKTQLMSVVSHELRSPLHGMIGLTGMMVESAAEGQKRQLQMVRACATRLLELVTNVMDLTEAEKRKQAGAPKKAPSAPVNFAEIAEEAVVMTSLAVDKANKSLVHSAVTLVNEITKMKELPVVLGDPYKCTQLIYNLLTNSCKFTSHGSVTIRARHMKAINRLEIDVVDTGVGIPEDAQKRIFKPFEQEHSHRGDARNFQGVGLGLAVCLEIIQQHNAQIRVHSKVGQGSTFTLSFACEPTETFQLTDKPSLSEEIVMARKDKESVTLSEIAVSNAASQAVSIAGSPRRPVVLSVDDDQVNQEVIKVALQEHYEIVIAMSGEEALDYLGQCKSNGTDFPDIVLLDIQMPGLTGFAVCTEIREKFEKSKGKLPVIMVSAKAPALQSAIESFQTGSSDFIPKPFDVSFLRHKVDVAIRIKSEVSVSGQANALNGTPREVSSQVCQTDAVSTPWSPRDMQELQQLREQAARLESEMARVQRAKLAQEDAALQAATQAARDRAALETELTRMHQELEAVMATKAKLAELDVDQSEYQRQDILAVKKHQTNGAASSWDSEHGDMESRQVSRLYRQLEEKDEVIVRLNGQLANHKACCSLVQSQLQHVRDATRIAQKSYRCLQDDGVPVVPMPPAEERPVRRRPIQKLTSGSCDYDAVC